MIISARHILGFPDVDRNSAGLRKLLFAFPAMVWLGPAMTMAQSQLDPVKAANLARQIGLSSTKSYLSDEEIRIPPSSMDPLSRSETIETGLRKYETIHNRYASTAGAVENLKIGTGALIGAGALLTAGTVAAPVTILLGGASEAGLEVLSHSVDAQGQAVADAYIAKFGEQVMKDAGIDKLESFDGRPEELQDLIRDGALNNEALLLDLKSRAGEAGADELVEMASDLIARHMSAMDDAMLAAMTNTSVDLDEANSRLTNLANGFQSELDRTKVKMGEYEETNKQIRADVKRLDDEVGAVRKGLDELGANQDLIVDFMFSDASSSEKARMLRSGLADSRITCPKEKAACDKGKIKADLIDRFETEAGIERNVRAAGKILQDINTAQRIADDLNLEIGPDGKRAIEVVSGAIGGYMKFMSGDPLGGIQAVTGIFASPKPDPDAVRFEKMMNYLKEQFKVVNEKLDEVLKNQETILDAVTAVSEQIQESHDILFAKLDQIEWLQVQTGQNVKQLLSREWRACQSLFNYVTIPVGSRPRRVNPSTLLFKDLDSILITLNEKGATASDCLRVFQLNSDSLSNVPMFGNFLSLSVDHSEPESLADPDEPRDPKDFRNKLRHHQEQVNLPSLAIGEAWMKDRGLAHDDLLQIYAARTDRISDVERLMARIEAGWTHGCHSRAIPDAKRSPGKTPPEDDLRDENLFISVDGLICGRLVSPGDLARSLVAEGLATSRVLNLVPWVIVLSQVADWQSDKIRDGTIVFAASLRELADQAAPDLPRGLEITLNMIDLTTLATAYENRIFGGITATLLADRINAGKTASFDFELLRQNQVLAQNTALVLMKRALIDAPASKPGLDQIFVQATNTARAGGEHALDPMKGLFGDQLDFVFHEENKSLRLRVSAGEEFALLPLPGPTQLIEGKFLMPASHAALQVARKRLVDRLADYELGRDPGITAAVLQSSGI